MYTARIVEIDLASVSMEVYADTAKLLRDRLGDPEVKNREAICEAFLFALKNSPGANASDLWHHLVYRLYCEVLTNFRPQDPTQSWKRASGDALEIALEKIHSEIFLPHEITISALTSRQSAKAVLKEIGIDDKVGGSKLDMVLRVRIADHVWATFGGVHVKASLAERVSDDVPCSRAMMAAGFFTPLWTLDVKSFPPPGDLVNRGELGSPLRPSDKRNYVEVHGDFDHCYSANSRSMPSVPPTQSGKLIMGLDLLNQPDAFATESIKRARGWLEEMRSRLSSLAK